LTEERQQNAEILVDTAVQQNAEILVDTAVLTKTHSSSIDVIYIVSENQLFNSKHLTNAGE
jgi:methanogenic corrinoid protein MtbC1